MKGRIGRRLGATSVVALLVGAAMLVGVGMAWAAISVTPYLEIATDEWAIWAPGPSGVAQKDANTMFVVDTDRNNYPEWDDDGINLWEISLTGDVIRTGVLSFREPTGVDYDPVSGTLYVSSDSDGGVYAITAGQDGQFGTGDEEENFIDVGGSDIEDPVFDPDTGDLFVLNGGLDGRIYRIDLPSETVLPNPIDISDFGADWEGLAMTPAGELLAGNNLGQEIHVFDTSGNYLQVIDVSDVPGLVRVSGLGVSTPGAGGDGYDIWVADRQATCNCDDPDNIDGRLWRLSTDGTPPPPSTTTTTSSTTTTTTPATTTTTSGGSTTTTTSSTTTTTTPATTTTTSGGSTTTTTMGTTTTTIPGTTTTTVPPNPGGNPFIDDDGSVFENSIEWLAAQGITQGCNPPLNNRFCPNDRVTRGQMATFLVRALHYLSTNNDWFVDDEGHIFENAINRLREAGVTQGCNPPDNTRFCPDAFVTRGQMAAFLVRAFGYSAGGSTDYFVDDNGHIFETAINRLRAAGVTLGCNPPTNNRYCPNDYVTRGQMAAFLKRALEG